MGSFDQACGVSKLPISNFIGNKCYILPINHRKHNDLNSGPFMDYAPLCMPIEGEYNDYGCIEKIVKNNHTEYLEKYFGLSIESIVDCLCDGRKTYGVEYTQYGSMMAAFGHKFSDLSRENVIHMGFEVAEDGEITHKVIENNIKINNGEFGDKTLTEELWKNIRKGVKFYLKKNIQDYPAYIVEVFVDGKKEDRVLDDIRKLCETFNARRNELKKNHRFNWSTEKEYFIFGVPTDRESQWRLKLLNEYTVCFIKKEIYERFIELAKKEFDEYPYDYCRNRIKETIEMITDIPQKVKAAEEYEKIWRSRKDKNLSKQEKEEFHKHYYYFSLTSSLAENCSLLRAFGNYKNIYMAEDMQFNEEFIPHLVDFYHFTTACYNTNTIIRPTHSLEQNGDRNALKKYSNIINEILDKEIKEINDEFGE